MPVSFFFTLMKKKMSVLEGIKFKGRIARLEKMLDEANKAGQIAFSEELIRKILVCMRESEMYAQGYKVFLTREIYERFCTKTAKRVLLTKMDNYSRVIPSDVVEKLDAAEKLKLFDAYYVMHYDSPNTVKETEKEVVKRQKDPILFGAIAYSDKLYYIADWEDEFCDLTLEDIVDKLDLKDEEITISKTPTL